MKHILKLFLIVSVILASCSENTVMRRLSEADRLLDQYPDSALAIVNSIDTLSLRGPEERARHSLLLTMALLKTDPSAVSDTIFKPAWKHYGPIGEPSRETMLAHFARAVLLERQDSLAEALMEFDYVASHANGKNAEKYSAMSLLNQGGIYCDNADPKTGLDYAIKASRAMKECRDTAKIINLDILLGLCHKGIADANAAEINFNSALNLCKRSKDTINYFKISGYLAEVHVLQGKYFLGVEEYEKLLLSDIPLSEDQLLSYVRSLIYTGRTDKANEILEDYRPSDNAMKVMYFHILSELYAVQGNYRMAYEMKDSLLRYNNLMILESMEFDIDSKMYAMLASLTEAERSLAVSEKENAIKSKVILGFIIVMIVAGSIFIIIRKNKEIKERGKEHAEEMKREKERSDEKEKTLQIRIQELEESRKREKEESDGQQKRIEELLSERETLYDQLNSKEERLQKMIDLKGKNQSEADEYRRLEEEASDVKNRILEISKEVSKRKNDMLQAFLDQHGQCASLCNRMPEIHGKRCLEHYEKERDMIIADYKESTFVAYLELRIDFLMDGFIAYVRNKLRMPEDMIRMLVYEICGFNYNSMALLFGITPQAAAARRTRLKNRLAGDMEENYYDLIRQHTHLLKYNDRNK